MPRPCKRRRICKEPACVHFGPRGGTGLQKDGVAMTLDEFECIRLMDLEHLTQEQCAVQMHVARTTIQAIYSSAREKLAACLVEGRELQITGGNYLLCKERQSCCRAHCVENAEKIAENQEKKGELKAMKIGVTYENGQVFQHFGHTEQFKIYEVQDNKVISSEVVDTNGSGHGALAGGDRRLRGGYGSLHLSLRGGDRLSRPEAVVSAVHGLPLFLRRVGVEAVCLRQGRLCPADPLQSGRLYDDLKAPVRGGSDRRLPDRRPRTAGAEMTGKFYFPS